MNCNGLTEIARYMKKSRWAHNKYKQFSVKKMQYFSSSCLFNNFSDNVSYCCWSVGQRRGFWMKLNLIRRRNNRHIISYNGIVYLSGWYSNWLPMICAALWGYHKRPFHDCNIPHSFSAATQQCQDLVMFPMCPNEFRSWWNKFGRR